MLNKQCAPIGDMRLITRQYGMCNSKVVKRTGSITECTKCESMQKEKKGDVGVVRRSDEADIV